MLPLISYWINDWVNNRKVGDLIRHRAHYDVTVIIGHQVKRCFIHWGVQNARNWFHKSSLRWRHNERGCVSNHQPRHCSLKRLFGRRSKKTSKLRVTGLCVGNSPRPGEFPTQMASNAENVSIGWRHNEWIIRYDSYKHWVKYFFCCGTHNNH